MRFSLLAAAVLVAGCNPLHEARRPDDVRPEARRLPDEWRQAGGEVAPPDRWWLALDDPALAALIERLLAQNLDLVQAAARIEQARAVARQSGSRLWPQLDAQVTVGASRVHTPSVSVGPGGVSTSVEPSVVETYGLAAAASYELDLFDRLGAATRAAEYDARASRLDYEALAVTLTAQAAELWYALVEQRSTEALLVAQVETNETLLDLMRFRFGEGLATATDVLQQEQLVISTRRRLPGVRAQRATLEHQLAVLLGEAPGRGSVGALDALPTPPPLPAAGLPSEVLARRPDIRAAQVRVAAADERVGAAIADRLPSLRLSAQAGFQADSFSDLLDRWVWSLTGQLVAPLFDAGRRSAEVDRTRAAVTAALAGFSQTVLRALAEVEDALVLVARQAETIERLEAELAVGQALLDQAQARYTEGLADYLLVLTALRGVQQAEVALLGARRLLLTHHIRLHRALGGAWAADEPPATLDSTARDALVEAGARGDAS